MGTDQKGKFTKEQETLFFPNHILRILQVTVSALLGGSRRWGILIVAGTARQGDGGTAGISCSLALFEPGPPGTPTELDYFQEFSYFFEHFIV